MSGRSSGLYAHRKSQVHGLHPWTKLIFAFCVLVASFAAPSIWFPIAFSLIGISLVLLGHVGKAYLRMMLKTIPLFVALFVIQSLFNPERQIPLFQLGPVTVWEEGVEFASLAASRLLAVITSMGLLVMTTRPADLVASIEDRGVSHGFSYSVLLILQIAPELQRRVSTIMDAQRARAIETEGSIGKRIRAFLPVLGPLVTSLLYGIETRALALEARGFSAPGKRTRLHPLSERRSEKVLWWAMPLAAASILVHRIVM